MNRHVTINDRYHARNCTRAYHATRRAHEDDRPLDALMFATEALTLADVGYGGELPPGALAELRETLDLSTDGRTVRGSEEVGR